jgi:hypothetical protein
MKKNKLKLIIFGTLIVILSSCYYYIYLPEKVIRDRCSFVVPKSIEMDDCYGVISINSAWDVGYIYLTDHIHNYQIARVYNINNIKIYNDYLYIINEEPEFVDTTGSKPLYLQHLFLDGNVSEIKAKNKSELLNYIIVNYKTGNLVAKQKIEDFDIADRDKFLK